MSTRKTPLPNGAAVVDPGDGTEPYVSERKEGLWRVCLAIAPDVWVGAEVDPRGRIWVPGNDRALGEDEISEWGPWLGRTPAQGLAPLMEWMREQGKLPVMALTTGNPTSH